MLEETGTVVERIGPDRVRIKVSRSTACEHCSAAGACQALAGQKNEMLVEVRDSLGVGVGQRVVIAIGEKTLLRASFLVYILPLAGLFGGVGLTQWLAPHASQAWMAAGGFGGVVLAFLAVHGYSRHFRSTEYLPVIIRLAE
jgi:sigma-E factor negative regulatory protein RseC